MSGVIIGPGIVVRPRNAVPPAPRESDRAAAPARPADQASRLRDMVEAAGAQRMRPPVAPPAERHSCPVVAITSGKGGVGKTNLSVNLSIALAACKVRTTLLDADLGLANADVLCGLSPTTRLDAVVDSRLPGASRSMDQIAVSAPGGFRLVPGAVGLARMANLSASQRSVLVGGLAELERESDVVLIDTAAGLSEGVTSFVAAADLTLLVLTPEPTSIADAYALMKCVARDCVRAAPNFAVIVNQAASAEEARAVHGRVAQTAKRFLGFEPPHLGTIPRDLAVPQAVCARTPFMLGAPRSDAAHACNELALALARRLRLPHVVRPLPGKGLFGWLTGR